MLEDNLKHGWNWKPTVAEKPIVKSELTQEQIDTKERVIQELKAQNDALDKQLAKEEAEKAEAEKTMVEQETKKLEKPVAKKESGKKSNKIILALGITFLLVVIIVGLLFVADWKNWSWAAFNIINKK